MAASQSKEDDSPRTIGGDREGRGFAASRTRGPAKQLECPALSASGGPHMVVARNRSFCDSECAAGPPNARDRRNSARDAMDRFGAGLHRPIACGCLRDREEKGELNRHENGK